MNRRIKVLQSMDTIGVGGTEAFVMNLYHAIDKTQFDFDFVVYDDYKTEYLDEILQNGDMVYQFHQKHKSKLWNYLDQKKFVSNILRNKQYDIVHCNGNSFLGILRAALPAQKFGIHVITHSHNMGEQKNNLIDRLVRDYFRKKVSSVADLGYACSDLAGIAKYTRKFRNSKLYKIINNGIDSKKYIFNNESRNRVRAELGAAEDEFVIGHVGRFEYPKNQSYLFDIFYEVLQINPNTRLVLIGDGAQRKEFEEKIHKLGISNKVMLLGVRMDVNKLYSGIDLLVLPSLNEGFPFVLVEAQINGLKCIVTDNISKKVNISRSVSFLSTDLDPRRWAEKIVNTHTRLSEGQIQEVINQYDISRVTNEIEIDYLALINIKE